MPIREKRIYSGDMLEVEIYEISNKERAKSRRRKIRESSLAQKNLNEKNRKKHLARLLNTNFTDNDIHLTLTYTQANLPDTKEKAERDIRNFLRRIRRYRKKQQLTELKYIAVIEWKGADGRANRAHHHIVMNGDMPRDEVEKIWKAGRCNSSRLQADHEGFAGLARYLTKERKSGKRWMQSRNLQQPRVAINDWKYSRAKFYRMVPEDIAKQFQAYRISKFEKTCNEITGENGISALFRRKET